MNILKSIVVLVLVILTTNSCKKVKKDTSKLKQEVEQTKKEVRDTILDEEVSRLPSISIESNQKISSPLEILLDSEGLWFASEGELGTITLFDENGKQLGNKAILSSIDGNWMHSGSAIFGATLIFDAKVSKTGKLLIENNPGPGEGEEAGVSKSFEIPIIF